MIQRKEGSLLDSAGTLPFGVYSTNLPEDKVKNI